MTALEQAKKSKQKLMVELTELKQQNEKAMKDLRHIKAAAK